MTVAFVTSKYGRESETFLYRQFRGLQSLGVTLCFWAFKSVSDPVEYLDQSEYRLVSDAGRTRSTATRFILGLKTLSRYPTAIFKISGLSRSGYLLQWLAAFSGCRYDVIHIHFGHNAVAGVFLKRVGIAKRLIVSFHGSDIYKPSDSQFQYALIFKYADCVTANSQYSGDSLIKRGCPEQKLQIVPMGINTAEWMPQPAKRTARAKIVLSVGRMVAKKGYEFALRSLALLAEHLEWEYWIVGDGSLRPSCELLIEKLGLSSRVKLLGALPNEQVRVVYDSADVFLLSSVTGPNGDMEGQGVVLQEAQAKQIPVITTRHNGCPESILAGETGLLVDEWDYYGLAEALEKLISNDELRHTMGSRGRELVQQKFEQSLLCSKLLGLYTGCTELN